MLETDLEDARIGGGFFFSLASLSSSLSLSPLLEMFSSDGFSGRGGKLGADLTVGDAVVEVGRDEGLENSDRRSVLDPVSERDPKEDPGREPKADPGRELVVEPGRELLVEPGRLVEPELLPLLLPSTLLGSRLFGPLARPFVI